MKFRDDENKKIFHDFINKSYNNLSGTERSPQDIDSPIKIERVLLDYMDDAIRLATEVFTYEQNIPENLIPIREDFKPIWWCAKAGDDIIGVVASWTENNQCHWGRFAVDKRLRGLGIGKKIAIFSLNEIFNLGVEKVFIEARAVTASMLIQLGSEVVGQPVDFYGEPVTPVTIKKYDYLKWWNTHLHAPTLYENPSDYTK